MNDIAAWPAPTTIVFKGGTNQRYAQITNWDANPDAALTHHWQPSRYDVAAIQSGTAVVDAVGQHAGKLQVGANGGAATLNVSGGRVEIGFELQIGYGGVGTVNQSGGEVIVGSSGVGINEGVYHLSGGMLSTLVLATSATGEFKFTGGTLTAELVDFDLTNDGGVIAPGRANNKMQIDGDLTINSGVLEIQLGDRGAFDVLEVGDAVRLGGTLRVELADFGAGLFVPTLGDQFSFLTATAGIMETFDAFEFPVLTPGLAWSLDVNAGNTMVLSVVAGGANSADFDGDGFVDGDDLAIWESGFGSTAQTTNATGDADGNGVVDGVDFLVWQRNATNFPAASASVPEPAAAGVGLIAFVVAGAFRREWRLRDNVSRRQR